MQWFSRFMKNCHFIMVYHVFVIRFKVAMFGYPMFIHGCWMILCWKLSLIRPGRISFDMPWPKETEKNTVMVAGWKITKWFQMYGDTIEIQISWRKVSRLVCVAICFRYAFLVHTTKHVFLLIWKLVIGTCLQETHILELIWKASFLYMDLFEPRLTPQL